jgi:hypothetical protein
MDRPTPLRTGKNTYINPHNPVFQIVHIYFCRSVTADDFREDKKSLNKKSPTLEQLIKTAALIQSRGGQFIVKGASG